MRWSARRRNSIAQGPRRIDPGQDNFKPDGLARATKRQKERPKRAGTARAWHGESRYRFDKSQHTGRIANREAHWGKVIPRWQARHAPQNTRQRFREFLCDDTWIAIEGAAGSFECS